MDEFRMKYSVRQGGGTIRNVAIYDRASTKPQATNGARLAVADDGAAMAEEHGWVLIESDVVHTKGKTWIDVGSGALTNNRPMLAAILERDDVDTVVVFHQDRFARGMEAHEVLVDRVKEAGKQLVFFTPEWEARMMDAFVAETIRIVNDRR